jgi:hypothetical protein
MGKINVSLRLKETSKKLHDKLKEDMKHFPEYQKLLNDCDKSKKHIKINLEKNICEHCYRLIELPKGPVESAYESELKSREKMHPLDVPCDAGYWMERIRNEHEGQRSLEDIHGFYRYLESLKKN